MLINSSKDKYNDVPQILRDYLNFMIVVKGKSPNTVREYYYDLRMFFRYVQASVKGFSLDEIRSVDLDDFDERILNEVTLTDLYAFMAYINNSHSDNDNYRARKVASLKSFFNYLHSKLNFIQNNPALNLDSPKIKKRMPRYLSLEESIDFLNTIDGKFQARDMAIFAILLNCGLRLSELVGINLKNINFEKRSLRVIGKGNKERMVYLNDFCMDALKKYLEVRPEVTVQADMDALFISSQGRRISNRMVELLAKKYFEKAGIDYDLYSPHKLRHTAATLMFKDGNVDIRTLQELLGHASLATTQIYTHIKNEDIKNAVDSNPLANMKIDTTKNEPS